MSIILFRPTFHLNHIEQENNKNAIVLSWSWGDSQNHFQKYSFLKYVLAIYKTLVLLYSQNLSKPLLTLAWSYTACVTKSWLKNIQHGTRLPPHQPKPCPILYYMCCSQLFHTERSWLQHKKANPTPTHPFLCNSNS